MKKIELGFPYKVLILMVLIALVALYFFLPERHRSYIIYKKAEIMSPDSYILKMQENMRQRRNWSEPSEGHSLNAIDYAPVSLMGMVIDAESRLAIPNVQVSVQGLPDSAVSTGEAGDYHLELLPKGKIVLVAKAPGYADSQLSVSSLAMMLGQAPTFALFRANASLGGRILRQNGEASDNNKVALFWSDSFIAETNSDLSGRFLFTDLPTGRDFQLFINDQKVQNVPHLRSSETRNLLDHKLQDSTKVTGRTVDKDGNPLGNVHLSVTQPLVEISQLYSDEAGYFQIEIPKLGNYRLIARTEQLAEAIPFEVLSNVNHLELGNVAISDAVSLKGRVLSQEGNPLANVAIYLREPLPLNMLNLNTNSLEKPAQEPHGFSNDDGYFEIHHLPKNIPFDITLYSKAHMPLTLERQVLPKNLELRLESLSSLSGQLISAVDGRPLVSGYVRLFRENNQQVLELDCDTEGRFIFDGLPKDKYFVVGQAPGMQISKSMLVNLRLEPKSLNVPLQPGASLSGKVYTVDGKPAANVTVKEFLLDQQSQVTAAQTLTDGDGQYYLDGIHPGETLIIAKHRDLGQNTMSYAAAEGHQVIDLTLTDEDLGKIFEISGVVRDSLGNWKEDVGLRLYALDSNRTLRTRSGEKGTFIFTGLKDGTYVLETTGIGQKKTRSEPILVRGRSVPNVVLSLPRMGRIAGKIVGLNKAQLKQTVLKLDRRIFPDYFNRETGEFSFESVNKGLRRISGRVAAENRVGSLTVQMKHETDQVEVSLVFSDGHRLYGSLIKDGEPQAGITVALSGVNKFQEVTTNDLGQYLFTGLSSGSYTLKAIFPQSWLKQQQVVEIYSDMAKDFEVRPLKLQAKVQHGITGEPLANVAVTNPNHSLILQTDESGFIETELSLAKVFMTIKHPGFALWKGNVDVTSDEGLVIELTPSEGVIVFLQNEDGTIPQSARLTWLQKGMFGMSDVDVAEDGRCQAGEAPIGTLNVVAVTENRMGILWDYQIPGPKKTIELQPSGRLTLALPDEAEKGTLVLRDQAGHRLHGDPLLRENQLQLLPGKWMIQFIGKRIYSGVVQINAGEKAELKLN